MGWVVGGVGAAVVVVLLVMMLKPAPQPPPTPNAAQQIGAGVGSLLSGILAAAGVGASPGGGS